MALKNGNKPAKGGKRKGAGRKPTYATQLKRAFIEKKQESAEYGFAYYDAVMRDKRQKTEIRLAAANRVMQEVWGMPKQKVEQSGEMTLHISPDQVKQARDELATWELQRKNASASSG